LPRLSPPRSPLPADRDASPDPHASPRAAPGQGRSAWWLALLAVASVAVTWSVAGGAALSASLPGMLRVLPWMAGLSIGSMLLRYLRWRWLLRRFANRLTPWRGFLAYVAGFAFTASPGKAGELVRIRYHAPFGIGAAQVFSAFLFERACDLVAVLVLSCLALAQPGLLLLAAAFVALLLAAIGVLARWPALLGRAADALAARGHPKLAGTLRAVRDGFAGCRIWLTLPDLSIGLAVGLAAWALTALSLVLLLAQLGFTLRWTAALSTYPLAMLVGAASMLPGGIGSTELAIVALLAPLGVPVATATLAAVGVRFATLWFAIACGLLAMLRLEALQSRGRSA
jgi:uncharacterized protein (TIRG00374 family)